MLIQLKRVVEETIDDPQSGRADLNRRPPAPHAGALNLAAPRPDVEGDYKPAVTAHVAIPQALQIAAAQTAHTVEHEWLATPDLTSSANDKLKQCDALWGVPASPYESMDGALAAIRYAREARLPFLGTCGGYQHAVLEYARHVLGHSDADNAEVNPKAAMPLIAPLSCALVEKNEIIELAADSYIRALYERANVNEKYRCR